MAQIKKGIGFIKEEWKEFAAFFGRNQQSAEVIMWLLRVGSVVLTFLGVSILISKWLETLGEKGYTNIEAAFSLFMGVLIEYGWNAFLPIVVRQAIYRKIGKAHGAWNIMFLFNLILVLVFGGLNAYTVYIGADDTGRNILNEFRPTDVSALDSAYQEALDSIHLSFEAKRKETIGFHDKIRANIIDLAARQVARENAEISYLRRREAKEETSYATLRSRNKANAAGSEAAAQEQIVEQLRLEKEELAAIQSREDAASAEAKTAYLAALKPIQENDANRRGQYDLLKGTAWYFMLVLALVFWAGLGVLIIIKELYKKQTNQSFGDYMHEYKESLFLSFLTGCSEVASAYLGGVFKKLHRFFMAWARIIGAWADYLIIAIEMKVPTPTEDSIPEDIRADPLKLANELAQHKANRSIGYQFGMSTPGQLGGALGAQTQLTTGFGQLSQDQYGVSREAGKTINVIVQNNEPLWPHVDGHNGKVKMKTIAQCRSFRSAYKNNISRLEKQISQFNTGKLKNKTASLQGLQEELAGHRVTLAYWEDALGNLLEERERIKLSNK